MEYTYEYSSYPVIPIWLIIIICAVVIIQIIAMWKVFTKAGQPGWAAIVPFYNIYIMTKIGGKPGYWVLLCLIPIVNYIFGVWLTNMISKSFGKDEGFTLGLIFLSFIFWPILGFGKARYLGPYGIPSEFNKSKFEFEENQENQP